MANKKEEKDLEEKNDSSQNTKKSEEKNDSSQDTKESEEKTKIQDDEMLLIHKDFKQILKISKNKLKNKIKTL